jgi:signal transduction histidine kinase
MLEDMFGALTDEQRNALELIMSKINQLNRLINDILLVRKIQPDTLQKQVLDINLMARQAIKEAKITYAKNELNFDASISETPCIVLVDPDRMYRVFDNLIMNAVKFSKAGGHIQVSTGIQDDWVYVKVKDDGEGIPKDKQPYIFEHFYQLRQTTKNDKDVPTTGLGLVIVRQIIDAHGGTIEFESEEGKGTLFHFHLPLERDPTRGI